MGEIDTDPEGVEQQMTTGLFDPSGVAILASFDPWVVTHGYSYSSPSGMGNAAQLLNSTAVLPGRRQSGQGQEVFSLNNLGLKADRRLTLPIVLCKKLVV